MIDWLAFVTVFATALVSSVVVVSLYSFGIKLLATPGLGAAVENGGVARDEENDDVNTSGGRPRWATIGAYVCFGLCVMAVLFGIYLIVPALHS